MDAGLQRAPLAEHPDAFPLTESLRRDSGGRKSSQNQKKKQDGRKAVQVARKAVNCETKVSGAVTVWLGQSAKFGAAGSNATEEQQGTCATACHDAARCSRRISPLPPKNPAEFVTTAQEGARPPALLRRPPHNRGLPYLCAKERGCRSPCICKGWRQAAQIGRNQ